jgi:hypothetical protein
MFNTTEVSAFELRRNLRILFENANDIEAFERDPRFQEFRGGLQENITDAESDENSTRYLALVWC